MYDSRYNYVKKKFDDKAKLLFTDTDSLTYKIETEDVYQDFWNDDNEFDNSDYPYFDKKNNKVIGKLKDEISSIAITHFDGFR